MVELSRRAMGVGKALTVSASATIRLVLKFYRRGKMPGYKRLRSASGATQ